MTDVTHVLAAIDFSSGSLAALDYALLLAGKEHQPTIHVVHSVALPTVPIASGDAILAADFDVRVRAEVEKSLRAVVAERAGKGVTLEAHLVDGPAAAAIVNEATRLSCGRIVVGTEGRGGIARFLLGSVAERVVRTSTSEVLVVPTPQKDAPPRTKIRNVVCATDFTGPAEVALLRALELARQHEARLHLVHAWHVAPYVERMPELCASIERDLARELDGTAHRHEVAGLPLLRHLRRGDARTEIVTAAIALDADLVVVGTMGKKGVDRFLLGSVAERVVRTSPVPVLVARSRPTD